MIARMAIILRKTFLKMIDATKRSILRLAFSNARTLWRTGWKLAADCAAGRAAAWLEVGLTSTPVSPRPP